MKNIISSFFQVKKFIKIILFFKMTQKVVLSQF